MFQQDAPVTPNRRWRLQPSGTNHERPLGVLLILINGMIVEDSWEAILGCNFVLFLGCLLRSFAKFLRNALVHSIALEVWTCSVEISPSCT